jgi:hypothetical protein
LAEYQRLDPGDPNPLDSLGEVQFFFTRYADAEGSFLKAHQKGPAFLSGMDLLKAAEARLMTGDSASADRLFQQFLAWRRNAMRDPLQPLWRAQWDFLSGRRPARVLRRGPIAGGSAVRVLVVCDWRLGRRARACRRGTA